VAYAASKQKKGSNLFARIAAGFRKPSKAKPSAKALAQKTGGGAARGKPTIGKFVKTAADSTRPKGVGGGQFASPTMDDIESMIRRAQK